VSDEKRRLPVIGVGDGPVRNDLDDGLRFVHVMGMQVKHDLFEASAKLLALLEELVAQGAIDPASFEKRRERIKEREQARQKSQAHVQVSELKDKYTLKNLPEIDCAAIIPVCKARCCKLWFSLSFQDLDEGVVKWDYAQPYVIRKRDDHSCTHQDPATSGCAIYQHRPGTCRVYDCRNDKRIWIDFDKRIPAPDDAVIP
jgi:Fe-S-cluster containining protein